MLKVGLSTANAQSVTEERFEKYAEAGITYMEISKSMMAGLYTNGVAFGRFFKRVSIG